MNPGKLVQHRLLAPLALIAAGFLFPGTSRAVTTWDLAANFTSPNNTCAAQFTQECPAWSYRNVSGALFSLWSSSTTSAMWNGIEQQSGSFTFTNNRWTDNASGPTGFTLSNGTNCTPPTPPNTPNCSTTSPTTNGPPVDWLSGKPGGVAYDVRWTAPFNTVITVSADVWMMRVLASNSQSVTVLKNGSVIGTSTVITSTSRWNSPMVVAGSASVYGSNFLQNTNDPNASFNAGDTLDIIVRPTSVDTPVYDFAGMDFRIDGTGSFTTTGPGPGVPEPAAFGLFGSGLAAIGLLLRRRRA